ncbi:hypothetical protein [Bacillus cereus]|uniref:hypothetical protein n=1 Tax=Bacillus cereus TaxID=1396 RepID=UPI003980130E
MIESLILVEGRNVNKETLKSIFLGNAKQLVIGTTPANDIILHVNASSSADFGDALLEFSQIQGVTKVLTLTLKNPH